MKYKEALRIFNWKVLRFSMLSLCDIIMLDNLVYEKHVRNCTPMMSIIIGIEVGLKH